MKAETANYKWAQREANRVLAENSVIEPPVPVISIAENYGLRVFVADFKGYENVSGYIDLAAQRIFVNRNDSENRQAFTIAHEIGHHVLHAERLREDPDFSIMYRAPIGGESDPVEQEANCFAANLLVPRQFLIEYQDLPLSKIAVIFGVSEEVASYRLKSLSWG